MNNNLLENYGYSEFFERQIDVLNLTEEELIPARILEIHREQYTIITEDGEKNARLKGSIFHNDDKNVVYPTVGDFVLVKRNTQGDDTIYKVLERKSKFSRIDTFYEVEQLVAANFDYIFIMTSMNHDFNVKRIERYLTVAWQSGAIPIIVLTKMDLCSNYDYYEEQLANVAIGVPILAVSSFTGEGIQKLETYIKPSKTVVFLGSSGVGKSSLVNAIAKEEIMKVSGIRESDSRGRHTTTHRQLTMLKNGTMIIDTPGMRLLGMWEVAEGMNKSFNDVEELFKKCRFSNCTHNSEPGCAVQEALKSGELSVSRWGNYKKLEKEAKFAQLKEEINRKQKQKASKKDVKKDRKTSQKKYYEEYI